MLVSNPITQFLRERALTRAASARGQVIKPCYDECIGGISRGAPLLSPPGFGSRHAECGGRPADACSRMVVEGCAASVRAEESMKPTDISTPDYFHKVVDCQWACPAHTPVPEYIRLIAAARSSRAHMVHWKSNAFSGILGR